MTEPKHLAMQFYRARRRKRAAQGEGVVVVPQAEGCRAVGSQDATSPCPHSTHEAPETTQGSDNE